MDDAQATAWNQAQGAGYVSELFELNLPWVTCMRCDAGAGEIGSACPGAPPIAEAGSPHPHRWLAVMSLELTEDEASSRQIQTRRSNRWCCRGRRTWCGRMRRSRGLC